MPSFDIVSKVDLQALDNAVNVVKKEIQNRFDFKDSPVDITLDKKEFTLKVETGDDMKMRQLMDVLINRAHKQGIAPTAFDLSKEPLFLMICLATPIDMAPKGLINIWPSTPFVLYHPLTSPLQPFENFSWLFTLNIRFDAAVFMYSPFTGPSKRL